MGLSFFFGGGWLSGSCRDVFCFFWCPARAAGTFGAKSSTKAAATLRSLIICTSQPVACKLAMFISDFVDIFGLRRSDNTRLCCLFRLQLLFTALLPLPRMLRGKLGGF